MPTPIFELYIGDLAMTNEARIATFEYSTAGKRKCVAAYRRIQKANPDAKVTIVDRWHKKPLHFTIGKGVRKNIMYITAFKSDGFFYDAIGTVAFGGVTHWIRHIGSYKIWLRLLAISKIANYITEPVTDEECDCCD